ncbi:Pituitary homeobox homolog Ptx1, partial [Eumeta japonica]
MPNQTILMPGNNRSISETTIKTENISNSGHDEPMTTTDEPKNDKKINVNAAKEHILRHSNCKSWNILSVETALSRHVDTRRNRHVDNLTEARV